MKIGNLFFILIIAIVSVVNLRYFFKPGIFQGHDSEMHLARIANYYLAIKDGHFPPRWARNLNFKFGYPVFNYNYPLANMLSYPLIVVGLGVEDSLKIVLFFGYFFGGLSFYLWSKNHFSRLSAFIGAIFYLCAPYQFLDLYVRGSIGETIAFGLLPLVLYFLNRLSKKINITNFLGLVTAVFIFSLSHNIMVLFFTPLIIAYWCYLVKLKKNKKFIRISFVSLFSGLLLTGFFWLPAFFGRNFVTLEAVDIKTFYLDHYVELKQLIYSPWQYGFSISGPNDTLSFQIGIFHWLVVILSLFFMVKFRKKLSHLLIFLMLFFWMVIFLMLPQSRFIWRALPILGYLQFPWRLLSLTIITSSFLACFISQKNKVLGVILATLCFIYSFPFTKPFFWEKKQDMYYYDYLFTTSTRHENMPRLFQENKSDQFKPRLTSDSGEVTFRELSWKTGKHIYEVNVPKETKIWEHTAYFPGWQGYIDGKKTEILFNNKDYPGIIGLDVPAGQHQIITRFTENTPARIIGDCLSLGSIIIILIQLKFIPKNKAKNGKK